MSWLVRNWHLKLGAVALATVLYTGLVYSGSFTEDEFRGIPIEAINQPNAAYPLTQQLGTVDVRYRLSSDTDDRVTVESFAVTVDLSEYDMELAPEPQALPISVRSLAGGVEVLDYQPKTVVVAIDRLGNKEVPVMVERGEVPEGLSIGAPEVSERTVIATGPESQLGRVERAVARVQVFESGIDVSQQVNLVPVDVDGARVEAVELDPATVTVQIDVRAVETSKTVRVVPSLTGSVADGFELLAVTVDPPVVTLLGSTETLSPIEEVATLPLSIVGMTASDSFEAELSVPSGTRLASGSGTPVVSVRVEPSVATRTFSLGVLCQGAPEGTACLPQQGQLSVTVRGSASLLADLDAGSLTPVLEVSGLGPGEHQVPPSVALPQGVELVSVSPSPVTVILQAPATPAPTPAPTPTPSPTPAAG